MPKKSGAKPVSVPVQKYPDDPVIARERAIRLARNPDFRMFVERTRDRLKERWLGAQETLARESLWFKMQGLNELLLSLKIAVDSGTRAEHDAQVAEMHKAERERAQAGAANHQPLDKSEE